MTIQSVRNQRDWQQAVERSIAAAKAGNMIAMQQAKVEAAAIKEEIDAYNALTPNAPIEVTFDTQLYIDKNKRQRGIATFDFPDVVFTTTGVDIVVDRYEIFGQEQGLPTLKPFTLMGTSTESSIYATDLFPGSTWLFRIRAICSELVKPGEFTPDYSVTIVADTTPPPQTSTPVATAVPGGVKVEWDGLTAGGGTMPGDFDHVELAFGMATSPTTVVDTFAGASFAIVPKSAYNAPHYFRLRAVDTSGNAGPWSPQAVAIPVPLVDADIILSAIDGAETEITNISGDALRDQAITREKLAMSDLATFAPSYRESPNDWTLDGGMTAVEDATVGAYDGYRFKSTATTNAAPAQRAMGPQIAVQPGEELYGEATIYRTGVTTNNMYPRFYFFDANHAYLISGGTELDGTAQKKNEVNGTKLAIKAVVPAGAMYANFMMTINNATGDDLGFYNARSYRRIKSDMIVDGSVTTTKLVVTGENLMWNGSGQTLNNTGWSLWGFDAADKAPGTLGSFTVNTQVTQNLANDQPVMQVEASTAYVLEGWIKASVTGSNTYIECMETGGTDPSPRYILSAYAVPTTWTRFSVPVTTSAGQTGMQFRMFANHSSGTVFNATQKLAGLRFRKQISADVIVNGGILTRHLTVTDDMVVALLNVHKIKAVDIDANNIVADSGTIGTLRSGILISDAVTTSILKADAITSKHTITGATFQTTTTANRGIKFTSTGLKMWDAGGVQTVDMNATTGYATITGRLRTAPDGSPGAVLIPPVESTDGKTMALWLASDVAQLIGGVTAGVWMSNPATAATAGAINIRGQQYGGVNLFDEVEFFSGDGTIPRMASNHGLGLQITSYSGSMFLGAPGAEMRLSSLNNMVLNIGAGKQLNFLSGGAAYNRTLSGTANAIIYTDGNVFKVSSASKYKIMPQVMELDDRLLDEVTVKDWIDIGMAERYAEALDVVGPMTEDADREFRALSLQRIPGTIAEDVEAAGGEKFVVRDLDGEIDSLMYDRFALARTEILKRRVRALEERLAKLEAVPA